MATPRAKVTIRLRPEQHNRISESARGVGMTINDYMVTCSLARQTDNENMAQICALLAEQTRAQVTAIDSGFGELLDALDERNRQAADAGIAADKERRDELKAIMQKFMAWVQENVEPKTKGGAK